MNKIFDKLLLVLGLLLLGGGIAVFVLKSGGSSSDLIKQSPNGGAYEAVASEPFQEVSVDWPAATEQEPGVLYDVFTPPKIFLDKDGRFSFEGRTFGPEKEWPIYLVGIAQKPYRIQLEGYIEEDRSDASKTLLLLFDEEKSESFRARPNDDKAEFELKVLSFNVERVGDAASGTLRKIATAKILDQRSGEEVVLTHGERLYEDEVTITIMSDEDPTFTAELSLVGDEFSYGEDTYILKEFSLEESSVSVEKIASDDSDSVTKTLLTRTTQTTVDHTSEEAEPEAPAIPTGFENFF